MTIVNGECYGKGYALTCYIQFININKFYKFSWNASEWMGVRAIFIVFVCTF